MSQNLKLNEQNNNFSEFNIIVETWIDIRDDFILPLRINIADIDFNTVHYIYNKFEKDKTQLIVDVRKNPFEDKLNFLNLLIITMNYMTKEHYLNI